MACSKQFTLTIAEADEPEPEWTIDNGWDVYYLLNPGSGIATASAVVDGLNTSFESEVMAPPGTFSEARFGRRIDNPIPMPGIHGVPPGSLIHAVLSYNLLSLAQYNMLVMSLHVGDQTASSNTPSIPSTRSIEVNYVSPGGDLFVEWAFFLQAGAFVGGPYTPPNTSIVGTFVMTITPP